MDGIVCEDKEPQDQNHGTEHSHENTASAVSRDAAAPRIVLKPRTIENSTLNLNPFNN